MFRVASREHDEVSAAPKLAMHAQHVFLIKSAYATIRIIRNPTE